MAISLQTMMVPKRRWSYQSSEIRGSFSTQKHYGAVGVCLHWQHRKWHWGSCEAQTLVLGKSIAWRRWEGKDRSRRQRGKEIVMQKGRCYYWRGNAEREGKLIASWQRWSWVKTWITLKDHTILSTHSTKNCHEAIKLLFSFYYSLLQFE